MSQTEIACFYEKQADYIVLRNTIKIELNYTYILACSEVIFYNPNHKFTFPTKQL